MSDDIAIKVEGLSKCYHTYDTPRDRLKQFLLPRIQRMLGLSPKQYYREFWALKDVSFEVKKGETVGIVGRNGSGKSTLLQIICGTLHPTSGGVKTNGRIAALLELGSGFNPDFTGRENVYMNGAVLGLSREEVDHRFDDINAFADIGQFIEQPMKTYSSGMMVRLAFSVAINVDPEILIVDEALAVGDEAFQRKCFARIETIRDNGGTILFVHHGAQAVVQLCDRAMLFDRGEIILEGQPKTVVNQYQRFANATAEVAENIRSQIFAMRDAPSGGELVADARGALADILQADPGESAEVANAGNGYCSAPLDYDDGYDPRLVSQSLVALEEQGARIRDVRITTLHGDQVNLLKMGKRYVFEYWVDFSVDVRDVGFACGIRITSGLLLAGASTFLSRKERWPKVRSGETKHVQFEFICNLLPGTYFWLCGTRGFVGSEEILLHRMMDVLCCRVLPEESSILTGHFDMSIVANVAS